MPYITDPSGRIVFVPENEDVPPVPFVGNEASPAIRTQTADLKNYNQAIAKQFAASDARMQQSNPVQPPETGGTAFMQPAQRGNYNMYNTDTSALPQPQTAGVNFGFGVDGAPSARQVLDRFALQDEQARQRQAAIAAQAGQDARLSELKDLRNDPVKYRMALKELELTSPQYAGLQQGLGAQALANTEAASREDIAATTAQAQLQQQLLANQGRQQEAQITGGLGVQAALARAQGQVAKAELESMSPEAQRAAMEAQLLGLQYDATLRGIASGELGTSQDVVAATRRGQEPRGLLQVDPGTGVLLTPEIQAVQQQMILERLRRQQQQQQ